MQRCSVAQRMRQRRWGGWKLWLTLCHVTQRTRRRHVVRQLGEHVRRRRRRAATRTAGVCLSSQSAGWAEQGAPAALLSALLCHARHHTDDRPAGCLHTWQVARHAKKCSRSGSRWAATSVLPPVVRCRGCQTGLVSMDSACGALCRL